MPVSQSGQVYGLNPAAVVGSAASMTLPNFGQNMQGANPASEILPTPTPATESIGTPPQSNYLAIIGAIVVLLLVAKFAGEHEKADLDLGHMRIGVYNFIAVGITALLFIVVAKVLAVKYPIKGLSQVIGAA